jgi:NADPH:quinone reductase
LRALLSETAGGPDSLRLGDVELPVDVPPACVRIAVRACAVNYPDVLMIADRYQTRPPRPFAPGLDVAGVVVAVGSDVPEFRHGDRVMAQCRWGGMAEQVDVPAGRCLSIPDRLPFDHAAAMLTTHGTARFALEECAGLRRGETVLVLGAAGGVGLAAVQLAKRAGARVVAAASSEAKLDVARRHGAEVGVVYPSGQLDMAASKELVGRLRHACAPGGAAVVVDVVGGDYAEAALRVIATEGRYLVIGFTAGIPRLPMNLVLLNRVRIHGVAWSADLEQEPDWLRRQMQRLVTRYEAGDIEPEISARFPLERGSEAIACLAERKVTGKVLVEI